MKIAILTDSGANLSAEFIKQHANLFVVPLIVTMDGKGYRDQIELGAEQVYENIDKFNITTSLPATEDLLTTLEQIKKAGFTEVLCINISSGLSGTFNAFRLAFEDVKGLKITQYDSKTLGMALGMLVERALVLGDKNTPVAKIIEALDKLRYEDSSAIYTVNTLKYLRKGGRIGKVEGTVGDLLHIKPVITVNDEGVYITLSKPFGMKRALIAMKTILTEKYGKDEIDLVVHYGTDPEGALKLGEKLKGDLNIRHLSISQLTPVLGVHTGPDMYAYIANRVSK